MNMKKAVIAAHIETALKNIAEWYLDVALI
jgi:hypothetical protein